MAAQLLLRKDLLSADRDLEHPARGWDQAQPPDVFTLRFEDLFRHTDGVREISSAVAILDRDFELSCHRRCLPRRGFRPPVSRALGPMSRRPRAWGCIPKSVIRPLDGHRPPAGSTSSSPTAHSLSAAASGAARPIPTGSSSSPASCTGARSGYP